MSLQMKKQGRSQFWKGILEIKELFYKNSKKIGNGNSTSFWTEVCSGMVTPPFKSDSKDHLSFL
jgi:hypothetical protein